MARLVLENASEFKKCIEAISVLIDEAEFVLEKDSLSLKATDHSQISMVDFRLPKKAFKEFELSSPSKIGLDLDYLSQIVSRAKASDVLEIELDSENSRLKLSFKGSSKRSFNIPLLDISRQELPTPKIEFEASLKIKAGELQEGLKDASSDTIVSIGLKANHPVNLAYNIGEASISYYLAPRIEG